MSSNGCEQLAAQVTALAALRPQSLTITELQQRIPQVTGLADRMRGWVDIAVGELAGRGGGQVPAVSGDGRAVPVPTWLRDATCCGGTAAGAQVRLSDRLRSCPRWPMRCWTVGSVGSRPRS